MPFFQSIHSRIFTPFVIGNVSWLVLVLLLICVHAESCQCRMLYDEEVQGYYKEFSASEPVRSANTPQPQFTVYPLGGTFVHGVKVTLFCNVSYNTPDQAAPFTVMWEHNGTTVDPSSGLVQSGTAVKQAGSAVYYSTLTISRFTESAQGDYVCRVGDGNYTIVSPVATLQLPSKW